MLLNFNISKYGSGKTYYEMNRNWSYVKKRIKNILDEKNSSRQYKIDMIISILENYESIYFKSNH